MKQHLTAIAFNEKELESYVLQLLTGGFETVSEVKKAEDGSFYQVLAKAGRGAASAPVQVATVSETATQPE